MIEKYITTAWCYLYCSERHIVVWEMTEESSTTSPLSVGAMTTTGMTQITGGMTSPFSRGNEFYFQCGVLVVGVLGTAANALILYALIASKQHKKHVLIVHQNVLDLFTSFFMIITYSLLLCNLYLTGPAGYWLCALLLSESFIWWGTIASVVNLAILTIERYLKVVHSTWSQNKLRNWMTYSAMAFAWIISFVHNVAVAIPTSAVIDGTCHSYAIWPSKTASIIYFIFGFLAFYIVIILMFIFCYWRILIVIRRQARVMATHAAAGPSTSQAHAQAQYNQIQSNVIKTMIFVSAFYTISWSPTYIYYLYLNISPRPHFTDIGYYGSVSIAYLYMCTNPFVYATKFDPVKEVLLRLIRCKISE